MGTASDFLKLLPYAYTARLCATRFCQSDDTIMRTYLYVLGVFLLPFFVQRPETVQRIQGPLTTHTRVIIGPGPTASASELLVSGNPFRPVPDPKKYYAIFFITMLLYVLLLTIFFIFILFLSPTYPSADYTRTAVAHTETETHLRLRASLLFIGSWPIIIPSSTRTLRRQWFSDDDDNKT